MFHAFPKLEMLHTHAYFDAIFDTEFPLDSLPKSLRSFVVGYSEKLRPTAFLMKLFGGLQHLTLSCMSPSFTPATFALLSNCRNLIRLAFYHDGTIDFSFLRSLPQLRSLAIFCLHGICVEDAAVISSEAPNIESLTLRLGTSQVTDFISDYFMAIGRELCFVKHLMISGDERLLIQFLRTFLANQSMFRSVVSVRLLGNVSDLNIPRNFRPDCKITPIMWNAKLSGHLCNICWGTRTSNWTCEICNCYVFPLR